MRKNITCTGLSEIAIIPLDETSRACLSNKTSTKLCKRERERII